VQAENKILKAIKHSSLREWLTTVGCHHADTYRHCLFVTGFAVAFAQHLGMREDDQRRLVRAALLHDVGKAFIPVAILDKPGLLNDEEKNEMRKHPRLGYDALARPGRLSAGDAGRGAAPPRIPRRHRISRRPARRGDQRHRAADDDRRYLRGAGGEARLPAAVHPRQGLSIMEKMGGKLDQHLLQAFRPVTLGAY
jgi:putative nucleotidyltransferase with HDIG domain